MRPMTQPLSALTSTPGTYLLVIDLPSFAGTVGALGFIRLPEGRYAYAGSALGPGGVTARVARHCRPDKPLRWHIDYLTAAAQVTLVLQQTGNARLECRWAQALLGLEGASAPVPRFGASDCRSGCPSHLIRLPDGCDLTHLEALLCKTLT